MGYSPCGNYQACARKVLLVDPTLIKKPGGLLSKIGDTHTQTAISQPGVCAGFPILCRWYTVCAHFPSGLVTWGGRKCNNTRGSCPQMESPHFSSSWVSRPFRRPVPKNWESGSRFRSLNHTVVCQTAPLDFSNQSPLADLAKLPPGPRRGQS